MTKPTISQKIIWHILRLKGLRFKGTRCNTPRPVKSTQWWGIGVAIENIQIGDTVEYQESTCSVRRMRAQSFEDFNQ